MNANLPSDTAPDGRLGGVNHVTFAVADLDRALAFYRDVLGSRLRARWTRGAYLETAAASGQAARTWICLELDPRAGFTPFEDSHVAFAVGARAFASLSEAVRASGAFIWKENRSEGLSLYFQDPDGHKLEIHVGDLESRLQSCREQPYDGMQFFEAEEEAPTALPARDAAEVPSSIW